MEQKKAKKATVVSYVSNKGGVSKTRHTLFSANALGAAGYSVIVIDMDFNNNSTSYYLFDEMIKEATKKNIAKAIASEDQSLWDFCLSTSHKNVWIVPSSRSLCDYRGMSDFYRIRTLVEKTEDVDFIIIDCQPNYDNLTINAINASDYIITPVFKNLDSVNAAIFLSEKIQAETKKYDNWFITICGYDQLYENSKGGKQREYLETFESLFAGHFTPKNTWFPWTTKVDDYKDRYLALSAKKIQGAICLPSLFNAVLNLIQCFTEDEITAPEVF